MRLYDISMPLRPEMPAFPGDPPFEVAPLRSVDRGDPYSLSRIGLGTHSGTHVDPPRHFDSVGAAADAIDLGILNGPCRVVDVAPSLREVPGALVESLPEGTERVLFRTSNSTRWARGDAFFSDYVALGTEAAAAIVSAGVRLVGLDSLSIESDPHGRYPTHRLLLRAGTLILEGLLLAEVPPGLYELVCLPLAVVDGDGAPARAMLRAPE